MSGHNLPVAFCEAAAESMFAKRAHGEASVGAGPATVALPAKKQRTVKEYDYGQFGQFASTIAEMGIDLEAYASDTIDKATKLLESCGEPIQTAIDGSLETLTFRFLALKGACGDKLRASCSELTVENMRSELNGYMEIEDFKKGQERSNCKEPLQNFQAEHQTLAEVKQHLSAFTVHSLAGEPQDKMRLTIIVDKFKEFIARVNEQCARVTNAIKQLDSKMGKPAAKIARAEAKVKMNAERVEVAQVRVAGSQQSNKNRALYFARFSFTCHTVMCDCAPCVISGL